MNDEGHNKGPSPLFPEVDAYRVRASLVEDLINLALKGQPVGFSPDLGRLWIGPWNYRGFGIQNPIELADGKLGYALRKIWEVNKFRTSKETFCFVGFSSQGHILMPGVEMVDVQRFTVDPDMFNNQRQELLQADSGMIIIGTLHAHPPEARYSPMSIVDLCNILVSASPGDPPSLIHGMASAKKNQAIVRTTQTPVITDPMEYESIRLEWNAKADELGSHVAQILDEDTQRKIIQKLASALPNLPTNEERAAQLLKYMFEELNEQGKENYAFLRGLEIADNVKNNVLTRLLNEHFDLGHMSKVAFVDLYVVVREAVSEATNYGMSMEMIYQFCHAFKALYLTGNTPEEHTSSDKGNVLRVDDRSRF